MKSQVPTAIASLRRGSLGVAATGREGGWQGGPSPYGGASESYSGVLLAVVSVFVGCTGMTGAGGAGGFDGSGAGLAGAGGDSAQTTGGSTGAGLGGSPGVGGMGEGATGSGGGGAGGAQGGRPGAGGRVGQGGSGPGSSGGAQGTVCARWKGDRADLTEGTWTGNLVACNAGDITGAGRPNALRQVNLFRFLGGLPAVTEDTANHADAQSCALLLDANKMLSHTPPATWTCYAAAGATAAGRSNIATTGGVRAIGLYMTDRGNETTIGHRRWILSNSLGPVAMGSTSEYSCLMVIGGTGTVGRAFAAWPPSGDVPLQALNLEGTVDTVGWSIQSDTINLGAAVVTVTDAGTNMPVMTSQLPADYGSRYAVRFVPTGWATAEGHTYQVVVTGTATPIAYAVNVVSCP